MMTAFLLYIGKVAVLLAVFYLFYRLLLDRETFHRLNRAVLLLSVLAAFILPLCEITLYKTVVAEWLPSDQDTMPMELQPNAPESGVYSILTWLFVCYIIGVAAKLIHTTVNIFRIHRLISHCEHHMQSDGTDIAVSPNDVPPFSWWNTIVFSRRDYDLHDSALLTHERAHINGYHSVDILLMEMVIALQWFNPAAWLIGRELRNVHEYEADASVLGSGIDTHHYLSLLMERANASHAFALANSISQKGLKSRFLMMARHRSKPLRLFKVLYVLPVVGITLALNARTIVEMQYVQPRTIKGTAETLDHQPVAGVQVSVKGKEGSTVSDANGEYLIEANNGDTIVWEYQGETSQLSVNDTVNYVALVTAPSEVKVAGTVTDEQGKPVVGAIVKVRDATKGTVTDYDGHYSLIVPKGATLDVMYIGMATKAVAADENQPNLNVTLIRDNSD